MKLITILLLLTLPFSIFATTEVFVEGEEEALPIAISKFNNKGKTDKDKYGEKIYKSLTYDLNLTPFFKVLNPKSFVNKDEGDSVSLINFKNWKLVGAEYLFKGSYSIKDGKIEFNMRIFSVVQEKKVFAKQYSGKISSAESFAHFIANDLYKFFTGQKGVFTTKILYVSKVRKKKQLFIMNIDATEKRALTNNRSINFIPSWAKTTAVLYTSYRKRNPDLYLQNIYTGKTIPLSRRRGLNTGGVLSPDGTKIALTLSKDGNSEIYLISAKDGSIIKRLTKNRAIDTSPTWSPDGKKIAFVSNRSYDPHIYIMNADGTEQKRVTFQGNYNQTPKWSPKGDRILFTARDERNKFDIFYIDLSNENKIVRLTQDNGNNEEPSWSPDGEFIVFTSTETGFSHIYIMDKDGNNRKQITTGKRNYYTPRWSPFKK